MTTSQDLDGLAHLREGEKPELEPLGEVRTGIELLVGNVAQTVVSLSDSSALPDYSAQVSELRQSPDKVWESAVPGTPFVHGGKINILSVGPQKITLTVVKPGNMVPLEVEIDREDVAEIKAILSDMQSRAEPWEKDDTMEGWQTPDGGFVKGDAGNVNGSTYVGFRKLKLGNGQILVWKVAHKNNGVIVEIQDELYVIDEVNDGIE